MKKYNVVLLGGSNSVKINGLSKGLLQKNINLINLALGSTTSIQNLYELKRERIQKLKNIDLIITESNVNDINANNNQYENLSLQKIYENLLYLYSELASLNTKVLVILLPYNKGEYKVINNIHLFFIKKFGFNLINLDAYYSENYLYDFHNIVDEGHPQNTIMRMLGENIINNMRDFNTHMFIKNKECFIICKPDELSIKKGKIIHSHYKNSMYNEKFIKIEDAILKFPKKYDGYRILAIHTWNQQNDLNLKQCLYNISNIFIKNKTSCIIKSTNFLNSVVELQKKIVIDDDTSISVFCDNKNYTEYYHAAHNWHSKAIFHTNLNLIGFLLLQNNEFEVNQIDFKVLANENIKIPKEYDFNYIIPPIQFYREIIDEYCARVDPKKKSSYENTISELKSKLIILEQNKIELIKEKKRVQQNYTILQNELNSFPIKKQQLEISNLEQDLINKKLQTKQLSKQLGIKMNEFMPKVTLINPNSAKQRIHNQLSYKLGQAMIINSKSLLGYIKMPFVLSYIKDKHNQEQKIYKAKIKKDPSLALPPLENYPDYKEALKEKECLTYKLGQALIKANKTWYGGGVYQVAI
ncbi:hypothetical protein [Campylobacter volucris]|uniref:hypothetical protein n=1 Tax=Campylobacter volucris TaxID=1031542 RepID=UPI001E4ADDFF|nr:hypothetical protein [Campylobacter volucris]